MSKLAQIPDHLMTELSIYLDRATLSNLCGTSRHFNNLLCRNELFWKNKYLFDFGQPNYGLISSWRKAYEVGLYDQVFVAGNNDYGQLGILGEGRSLAKLPNLRAKSVSAGGYHSVVITPEEDVYAFGEGGEGQLGLGEFIEELPTPTKIPGFKAKAVATGDVSTFFIAVDDSVWACGENYGQKLAIPGEKYIYTPRKVEGLKAKQIAAGSYHCLVLATDGTVWVFGDNSFGQLGLGPGAPKVVSTPVQIPNLRASYVAAGGDHSIIIDLENTVFSFGSNDLGETGLGEDEEEEIIPTPTELPGIVGIKAALGANHTLILDQEGSIWAFGSNSRGELGTGWGYPDMIPEPVKLKLKARDVFAGSNFSFFVDSEDGRVYAFGDNGDGQLGFEGMAHLPTEIPGLRVKEISGGNDFMLAVGKFVQ